MFFSQAFLRNVSYSIKSGVDKFKSAVDLMFDASATFMSIHNKIISYCPELEEQNSAQAPENQIDGLCLSGSQLQPSTTILSSASNDATAAGSGFYLCLSVVFSIRLYRLIFQTFLFDLQVKPLYQLQFRKVERVVLNQW